MAEDQDKISVPPAAPNTHPRDLFNMTDIRVVMVEIGKLSANVDTLIKTVDKHGDKLEAIATKEAWTRGVIAAVGAVLTIFVAFGGFWVSGKFDAIAPVLQQLKTEAAKSSK
jgi:hypothetical protein